MRRIRRHRYRRTLDDACMLFLRSGVQFEGWGQGYATDSASGLLADEMTAEQLAELLPIMRADWQRHRQAIEAEHLDWSRDPLSRCWAWWQFEATEPRLTCVPEWLQMFAMGFATREQAIERAKADLHERTRNQYIYHAGRIFRRDPSFWLLLADAPRDFALSEVAQLAQLKVLAVAERHLLDGEPETIAHWSKRLPHLTPDERKLLGLPACDQQPNGWRVQEQALLDQAIRDYTPRLRSN